jgi:hypothetical protein
VTLWRPDGKTVLWSRIAAFETALRTAARRYLVPVFGTTTGWAIILCIFGITVILQPFLPLAELQVLDVRNRSIPIAEVFGYQSIFAIGAGAIFGSLLLLLVATSFIEPIPPWRSCLIILAGMGSILVMGLSIQSNGRLTDVSKLTGDPVQGVQGEYRFVVLGNGITITYTIPKGEFHVLGKSTVVNLPGGKGLPSGLTRVAMTFPAYLIIAISLGLLLLGTLQLRGVLMRRRHSLGHAR